MSDNIVIPYYACPWCTESRTDYLLLDEDGKTIHCETCGEAYDPNDWEGTGAEEE